MKQRTIAVRFSLILLVVIVVAVLAYKFFGIGAANQVNLSDANGKIAVATNATATTTASSARRLDTLQYPSSGALNISANPARDQWITLTKAVVTSQEWAQTIAMLKNHPDANRWLIIMSFQNVCDGVHMQPLLEKYLPYMVSNQRIPASERQNHAALSQEAHERCGNPDELNQRTAWRKLPEVTAASMGVTPGFYDGFYKTGITDAQAIAISNIVRTPEQLAQWLTSMSLEKIPEKLRPEYFNQLKPFDYTSADNGEFSAVNWLITCELGDGCGSGSIHRYQACIRDYFCSGHSVIDAMESRFGMERMQIIRTTANLFLADIAKRGVNVFAFPRKKTP